MHARSWPRVASITAVLATMLVPAFATAGATETYGAVLGGDRGVFEARYGAPVGAAPADGAAAGAIYKVDGFKTVMVSWQGGRSDQIVLTAPDGWSSGEAKEIARRFSPADATFSTNQSSISNVNGRTVGQIVRIGSSDLLAGRFSRAAYAMAGVNGRPGDLRVAMIYNQHNRIATIDIAIGASWSSR